MPPMDGATPEVNATPELINDQPIATDGGQGAELPQDSPVDGGTPPAEPTDQTPEVTPEPPREDPLNKRFSDVTKARDEALKRAEEADQRLQTALEALERLGLTEPPEPQDITPPVEEDPEPVPPEFEDPEQYRTAMAEYTKAVTEWTVRRVTKAEKAEAEQAKAEAEVRAQQIAHQQRWMERRTKAIEKMLDYAEVAERPDVAITPAMAAAITSDEMGPELAYHLGKNPDVAARIAALPLPLQGVELGLLKAQISAPPQVQTSKAPPPINPLTGGTTPQQRTPDEMSMEEYAAMRRQSQ